jgi:Flp pilus assembly protein TadG
MRNPESKMERGPAGKPCCPRRRRRGMVLLLFAVSLVTLMAFVGLAIDLGAMELASTQVNDAADAAALAGARALNGNTAVNNNYAGVAPAAQQAVTYNSVMGAPLTASQLSLNIGRYTYVAADQQFEGQFPGPSTQNWNMVQATVTKSTGNCMFFSKVFTMSTSNLQSTATAAYRPRDVTLILDYSGSMRFGSLLGLLYYGNRSSNNQDTVYPTWGPYAGNSSLLLAPNASSPYLNANISTTTSDGRPPVVLDFYTSATGGTAFTAASATYATTPGGDNYLKTSNNTGAGYAQTLTQILGSSSYNSNWETKGYKEFTGTTFNGYTQGPGYWGKTFYIWPPDPTNDWRKKYFYNWGGTTPMNDNTNMWDSQGNLLTPGNGNFAVNYNAILNFILNVGPSVFPSQLQSGRIVYYTQIPTSISTSAWPPADLNQRFWKEYIDYVVGVMQTSSSNYQIINNGNMGLTGYGMDFNWGSSQVNSASGNPTPYMNYNDNPQRPLLGFWFGPMTMIDFLGNYNLWYSVNPNCSHFCWWPGTCHETPLSDCKLGISAALSDMLNNHPNDYVSMIMFSVPRNSANDVSDDRFNRVRVALGQNFTNLQQSLWYPPSTVGTSNTVTPYDSNNIEVPRAMGGTCYAYPLMLAYNQFSSNASLQTFNPAYPSGDAGGNGRQGAQKIIIFETDGAPNTTASASFVSNGTCQSYYKVRYNSATPSASDFPTSVNGYNDNDPTVTSQIYGICTQLAKPTTSGGYGTTNRPVLIHCIAFGPAGPTALSTLNQMQTLGNVNDGMPAYKQINGNSATIISNLQTAIAKILQDGVQVNLIQ